MDKFSLNVVAGEAKGGLSQVVSTEAEEVGLSSNLISGYGSARKLDHGTDLDSIKTFYGIGLDYVSCSPYRVPLARLADK